MYEDTTSEEEEEEEVESETSVSSDGDDATTTTTSDDEGEDDATSASEDEGARQKANVNAGRAAAVPPIAFPEAVLPSPPRRRSLRAPPQTQPPQQPPQPRLPRVRVPAPAPASPRGVDDALLVSGVGPCGAGAGGLLGSPGPVALALTPRCASGPPPSAAPTRLRSPRGPTFMTPPPKKRPGPRTRAATAVAAATRPATPAGVPRPPAPGGDDVAAILDAGVCVATAVGLFDHGEDGGLAPTAAPPPSPTASARAPVAAWPPSSAPWVPLPAPPRLDLDAVIARVTQTVTSSPSLRARVVGPEWSGGRARARRPAAPPPPPAHPPWPLPPSA